MIREAERTDREQIVKLYRMLVPTSRKMNVLEDQIEIIRRDTRNFLLVYEEEGELLGTLTLNICLQAMHGTRPYGRPYGIVENIVVHEEHRSNQIGRKLLQHVEDYCRSTDCHKIMLLSHSARHRAHQFFEREGYSGSVSKGFKKYL
jgi:GNAT superfamily N-acetyltransferase